MFDKIVGPIIGIIGICYIVLITLSISSCVSENTMGIEDPVSVYLALTQSGYSVKISCEGQIVSMMDFVGEKDTISVPDDTELKARIWHDNKIKYETIRVTNKLSWVLP